MPLDNSPATNAQSLLNGIDYSALIGGPLQAAITAQAMAAKSTWEFIKEVGLQTDADGNKSAVNVTFLYQKDGQMVKLIVPILTIVPIPLIVVDELNIEFKATINAAASSTTEETESSAMNGELEAEAKVGWGPFSLSARMKAGYSSKKDSKATQDSRYSVEYTQDVRVHATQAGMPAGLATVLNILSSAATGATRDGELRVSPPLLTLDVTRPELKQNFQIKLIDGNGMNIEGTEVVLSLPKTYAAAFSIGKAPLGKAIAWTDGADETSEIKVTTGADGAANLLLSLSGDETVKPPTDGIAELKIATQIDTRARQYELPIKIAGVLPPPPPEKAKLTGGQPRLTGARARLIPLPPSREVKRDGAEVDAGLHATRADGTPATDAEVKVTFDAPGLTLKSGGKDVASPGSLRTDEQGVLAVRVGLDPASTLKPGEKATVRFTAQIDGQPAECTIGFDVKP